MESESEAGLTKVERAKAFTAGFCLAAVSVICNVVAFSLDYWLYTPLFQSSVGLQHAGLWSFCVQSLVDERSRMAIPGVFYGCHWIFDPYFNKIRWTILNPPWFITVQIMAIISLLLSLIGIIALMVALRHPERFGAQVFGTLSIINAGLFSFLEAGIFAVYSTDTQFYTITNIQTKRLGPAWYLGLISALFATAAMMALVSSLVTARRRRRQRKRQLATHQLAAGQHAAAAKPAFRAGR